jgi:hypothetical protein
MDETVFLMMHGISYTDLRIMPLKLRIKMSQVLSQAYPKKKILSNSEGESE